MNDFCFKKILSRICIVAPLSGCALAPYIAVDASGTGQSELGKIVAKESLFGAATMEHSITKMIQSNHILESGNPIAGLEKAGFSCPTHQECVYEGTVRSKLVMTDGSVLPGNDQTRRYKVTVRVDGATAKVTVTQSTEFNNGQHGDPIPAKPL